MNAKNGIIAENDLLELTDTELEIVSGGFTITGGGFVGPFGGFNTGAINQGGFANSSFTGGANFPLLLSNAGGLQVGGNAVSGGDFFNNGFNNSPF